MEMYLRGRLVRIYGEVEGPDRTVGIYSTIYLPMVITDVETGQELDWLDLDSPRMLTAGEEQAITEAWAAENDMLEGEYHWLVWYWIFDAPVGEERLTLVYEWHRDWL